MLNALKSELKRLSIDEHDPFHEKVRRRIGKRATHVLEKRLKQIILIMPDLVKRIHLKWEVEQSNSDIKKLGGFIFAYMYHPKDFLSEDDHGLFGYLDDAYLVAIIYEKVASHTFIIESYDEDLLEVISKTKKYVEALIPTETQKIKEMVNSALAGDGYADFAEAFSGAA